MCNGGLSNRRRARPVTAGTDSSATLPWPLLQQSGLFQHFFKMIYLHTVQYSGFVKWLLFFRCPLDVSVVLRCNSDHQAVITCNETFESCNDPMSFWPCESLYFKSSVCFCPILMGVFLVSGGRSNPWTGAAAHFSAHVDVPPAGEHCSTTLMILTEIAVCSRSSFIHWPLHFVNIFCCKCTNNSSI